MATRCRLGKTDIEVTPVGLGCWQFSAGQGLAGKYWGTIPQSAVDQVVEASLAAALRHAGIINGEVVVATKWAPTFRTANSIKSTI